MMVDIQDFSEEYSPLGSETIVVFNPNPYPVTASMFGHTLGGHSYAKVYAHDYFAQKMISSGLLLKTEVQQTQAKSKKKK